MYVRNNSTSYNGLGSHFGQGPYNPYPGYSTDPTQVPIMPGYPYGIPGIGYPGYAFGHRIIEMDDAVRMAKERQVALEQRAATTTNPAHKYLSPDRKLSAAQKSLFDKIERNKEEAEKKKLAKSMESKLSAAIMASMLLSAFLRA